MPSRPQAPRQRPAYDWDTDGGASRQGAGIYILQPDVQATVKKPSWFGTETVFRPFPCVSFEKPDTEFEPYRIVQGDRNRFSDWIRRYNCAWAVGSPATTFLIKKPHKLYDPWTGPLGILYRAIENACKKGTGKPEWQPLREGGMNKGKQLKGPSECYMMQGAMLAHDKTVYLGKDGPPLGWGKNPTTILLCSMDAGKGVLDLLSAEKEGYRGPATDFESRYVHGDPVSPLFGRFFHFWERGSKGRANYGSQPTQASWDDMPDGQAAANGAQRSTQMQAKGFDVEIATHYNKLAATYNKAGEDQIREHWKDWDKILYLPTEIEQAHMLFRCFPASACIYAFEGHNKDWLPEDAYKIANEAMTANVPGAVPGSGLKEAPGFGGDGLDGWGTSADPEPSAPLNGSANGAPAGTHIGAAVVPATTGTAVSEEDPYGGNSGPTAVEDTTVPSGGIPETVAAEEQPQPPARPAAPPAERTAAALAQMAATRSKIK